MPLGENPSNVTGNEELSTVPKSSAVASNPKKRRWLPLILISLVVLLVVVGIFGVMIFQNKANIESGDSAAYLSSLVGSGTQAFSDSLREESQSQWSSETSTSETCECASGAYHVKQQSNAFMGCNAHGAYSNLAFEVQLTIIENGCGGIVFRDKGDGYFYYFSICESGDHGRYDIARFADYSPFQHLPYGDSPLIHPGKSNKIAVAAIGGAMTFYVNEQQIAQAQDTVYTEGGVGLAAYPNYGSVAHVVYSNAKLWTL